MTREFYESDEDRGRELAFIEDLKEYFGCECVKLNIKYGLDYALVQGEKIIGWLELKERTFPSDKYPEDMLSLGKWMKALELNRVSKCPFFLAVRFTDKDLMFLYGGQEIPVIYKGRTIKTRDEWDVEPVVMIPKKYFEEIPRRGSR